MPGDPRLSALRLEPHYAEARFNLGLGWFEKRNHAEAVRDFQYALESDPNLLPARKHLALAHAHLGDESDARTQMQWACDLAVRRGNLEEARRLREEVEALLNPGSSPHTVEAPAEPPQAPEAAPPSMPESRSRSKTRGKRGRRR